MNNFLETKRLILKPIDPSHLDDLFALRSDPDVMKYIGESGATQTREEVENFIQCGTGYYEEYGLDFFSVYEKETGAFVGQAGLFHVGFDVKQSDIELAYRLHTKYWNKGYATELAKTLIEYGFNKLSLPKIIAAVRPENERSRRVMEKAGMSYIGIVDFRGKPWPCYEIYNNKINFNKVKLIPAVIEDYPVIQNMASYYSYDMSEYMGWAQDADGRQSVGMDYLKYWNTKNTFPFIIKFQGIGIGRHIAFQCFDQFQGRWEVFVMPGNEGAYRFWRKTIQAYTQNDFKEYTRTVGKSIRNIFEFSSKMG